MYLKKFVPCRKCFGKAFKEGYITKKMMINGKEETLLEECECLKKWREENSLDIKLEKAGIPKSIKDYSFDKYVGNKSLDNVNRLKKFLFRFCNDLELEDVKKQLQEVSLWIYGPNGTQKTTLAQYLGYSFLVNKKTVKYILMNDLIKLLQKSERDEDLQIEVEKLINTDILIIDEAFMKERVLIYKSQYQLSFLDSFLRNRLQSKKKGIVWISNIQLQSIDESIFGIGIKDLVNRTIILSKGELEFKDVYLDIVQDIDEEALF